MKNIIKYFILINFVTFLFINISHALAPVKYPCENYKEKVCDKIDPKFKLKEQFIISKKNLAWSSDTELAEKILNNYNNLNMSIQWLGGQYKMKNLVEKYGWRWFGVEVEYDQNKIRDQQFDKIIKKNINKINDINQLSKTLYFKENRNPLLKNKSSRDFYCNNCNLENINLKSSTIGWDLVNSNLNNSDLSKTNTWLPMLNNGTGTQKNTSFSTIFAELKPEFCKNKRNDMYLNVGDPCKVYSGVGPSSINLSGSTFVNSKLKGAVFKYGDLTNTDFTGADLTNVDLSFSDLRGAIFVNSNLTNTNFQGAILDNTIFDGALINRTKFNNTIFEESELDSFEYDKLAVQLGCNPGKKKKLDKCIKGQFKSQFGKKVDPVYLKKQHSVIKILTKKIEIVNIKKSAINGSKQNKNTPAPPPNKASENSNKKIKLKFDQYGRTYWDYGNGLGYMPKDYSFDYLVDINAKYFPEHLKDMVLIEQGGFVSVQGNNTIKLY